MNDNDLLTAVREDFAGVRMNTDAGVILAGGGSLRRRRRRRLACGTGVAALATVAALSAASLTAGSAGTAGHAELTAWTVQRQPNGTIDVTIHDLLNLAGLQQKLSADGVHAEVISDTRYPAGCVDRHAMTQDMTSVITLGPAVPGRYAFVIHPAAIPSGSKLLLDVTHLTTVTSGGTTTAGGSVGDRLWALGAGSKDFSVGAGMGLVYDSGTC